MVRKDPRAFTEKVTMLFVVLAELFLGFRVILSLLDADFTNSFIRWVYTMTESLMLPFRGIFPDVTYDNVHILEFPVLFAMAAYAFVGYLLVAVVYWLPKPPVTKKKK